MARSGTQTLERGLRVLRELASRGTVGWRLSDLARRCNLDQGTAHRLVACLVRERLARQRADRRYVPGPLLFELSLSLPGYAAFRHAAAAPLERVAAKLGGHAFLCLRSGSDFVCAANAGTSATRGLEHEVGLRRPLVVSAGGMAILVALPAAEAAAVVAENMKRVQAAGEVRAQAVERMLKRSRAQGCGLHLSDIVPEVHTCGVAVRDARGAPFASVSVARPAQDFPPARLPQALAVLDEAARLLARDAARLLEEPALR